MKDLFNTLDQYLVDELSEVQNVFHQMEQAVEQHRLESKTFEVKLNQVLNENERLLEQVINKDIVNIIMNSSVDNVSVNVHECEKCLKLETELLNKKDFIEKEIYDKLFKSFTTLEKHCISLEVDTQLNQEIFQRDNSVSNQSAPSFDQLFELNELKAQSQEKDTVIKKLKERIKSLSGKINEDKIKKDLEEIETINIELDHRVSKLIAKNEHLKQTYKQLYDSIKPTRIRSKEQCDDLINQVNLKSVEISDLNASLQEKVFEITALKIDLRKFKGKALVDNAVTKHTIDPKKLKIDVEPITPKLLNKRIAHSAYIKHTQEEAAVLRDLVDHVRANYPLDHSLESACRYTKLIQELLTNISKTCPSVNNTDGKLMDVTPKNKDKRVRSLYIKPRTAHVQHSKLNAYSELKCVKCNGCMLFDNHDLCVLDFINNVNARKQSKSVKKSSKRKVWKPTGKVFTNIGYIWRPTGQTFTIVGNVYCPPSKTAKQLEEIHNFKQEGDETLYQAWERYNDLLYKCPTHDINNHQKVNIFYNGLGAMNRQLLDSQGPIPSMTPVQALTVIQTMADHFQKWHDGSSSRSIKDLGANVNVIPKSMFEHLKLDRLKKTDMLVEMADMTKRSPIRIVENVLVKIDKFLFPSDFVVMDMLNTRNETMILGRPFLATIHAEIDVFNKEISLGIRGKDNKDKSEQNQSKPTKKRKRQDKSEEWKPI
ncbi:retrovirus-related pol polyprotein from transposon TNT 1-94 [Tanacetum coccineum]|uniref:Retrovirus-related pol polyprotein from transposon TNT 1-94 n=1 Tax=Tanacetum coccineum TaxID=301880 RepID=A0ABQ5E3Q5_9ASTR